MDVQDKAASTGADAASSFFARCVVSLGLYWAWTFFSFNPPISSAFPVAALHVTSMVGASVSFLAVCLLRHRIAPLCGRKTLLVACGMLTAATTPLYLMPGVPSPVALAAACVSGAAVALVVCALAEAFARLSVRQLLGGTILVFLIAYAVLLLLSGLSAFAPRLVVVILASLLPVASALFVTAGGASERCGGASQGASGTSVSIADQGGQVAPAYEVAVAAVAKAGQGQGLSAKDAARAEFAALPWRTFCVIACMYFAIGGIRVYVERVTGDLMMSPVWLGVGIVVLALAYTGVFCAAKKPVASLGALYKITLPLVAAAYAVLLTVGQDHPEILGFIAQIACLVTECLCWVLIVDRARRGVSALLVIGAGRFVVQFGMSLGELAGFVGMGNMSLFGTLVIFLLVLSFVFLFSERETSLGAKGQADEAAGLEPGAAADAGSECLPLNAAAAEPSQPVVPAGPLYPPEWNLTEREDEILGLWVTSHGLRSIGETLGLSESTVKTHVRHIYEKCGVHSRAELIALLDRVRQG